MNGDLSLEIRLHQGGTDSAVQQRKMFPHALGLAICVLLATLLPPPARADALRKVDRTTQERTSKRERDSSHSEGHDHAVDDDGGAWQFVLAPFLVPRMFDDPRLDGYARHPHDGHGGLAVSAERDGVRAVALQVDVEGGYALQGVVPATFALRLQLPARLELSSRTSLLSDIRSKSPESATSTTALLSVRFAQSAHAEFRVGLGMRQFRLDDPRFGFDAMYAIDLFARHGITSRLEFHLGSLDRSVVLEGRGTLGIMFGPVELYAGGMVTSFVGAQTSSRLGGPILGVRIWM